MAHKKLAVEERRFVIWCEEGDVPTRVHPTWEAASKEANRLAHLNRGKRFHIMGTTSIRCKAPAEEAVAAEAEQVAA